MMKFHFRTYILLASVSCCSLLLLPGCVHPKSQQWHRPARPGERVGQVATVKGSTVTVSIDEPCQVHLGNLLVVKRLYLEPGTKKAMKGGKLYPSGHLTVTAIDANDHLATGKLTDGMAVVDAPVFMDDHEHADPAYEH